jgi:hypothetical protein
MRILSTAAASQKQEWMPKSASKPTSKEYFLVMVPWGRAASSVVSARLASIRVVIQFGNDLSLRSR